MEKQLDYKKTKKDLDMSLIEFKHVSYNRLRDYMTGRRMYFNCRVNTWEDMVICIGVFYRNFLCGGIMLTKREENGVLIQTWYSRDGRAKIELLEYCVNLSKLLGFCKIILPIQKKCLSLLLNDGWKKSENCLYKEI